MTGFLTIWFIGWVVMTMFTFNVTVFVAENKKAERWLDVLMAFMGIIAWPMFLGVVISDIYKATVLKERNNV